MVETVRVVQQEFNLNPLSYSAGSLKILKESGANPRVPGARAVLFIDDVTVALPLDISLSRHGSYSDSQRMAAGTSGGRRHLAKPHEVASPAGG